MTRPKSSQLDGVFLLDKPFGMSSNNAMQKVRWLFNAKKAGHTGNLDPYATGLLPICFGEATKFAQRGLEADKGYHATITLGATSSTGDGEGEIIQTGKTIPDLSQIHATLPNFIGKISQIPPMYSALKHEGKALYEYARKGIEIERAARTIFIRKLDFVSFTDKVLVVDVICSKGTYIRTLAEDIGKALGCGAYLSGLRRTFSEPFDISQLVTIEALEASDDRYGFLLPVEVLLADLPALHLAHDEAIKMLQGRVLVLPDIVAGEYRLYLASELIGVATMNTAGELKAKRMFASAVARYL
jgi:tRNA pseudouridine55 synthase